MKLSVEKRKAIWIKIGLSVVFYGASLVLLSSKSYTLFIPLGISYILLGYSFRDFQYLRERSRRLIISYVILIWWSWFNVIWLLLEIDASDKIESAIWGYGFILALILSVLTYFLISKKAKSVFIARKKYLDEKNNFSNKLSVDELKKLINHLKAINSFKVTFSLLFLTNILAFMAIPLKQYVSLAFAIPVVTVAAILPLSKYLKEKPGQLSFAYIVLIAGSYLMILPAAVVGFVLHYGSSNLIPILIYIPLGLAAILLLIYLPNRANINPIVKGILGKMCYERKSRINAFNQLGEAEAKKYKNKLYLTVFISLIILNVLALVTYALIGLDNSDRDIYIFVSSHVAYFILAAFILKRFLPIARLYPLILSHYFLVFAFLEGAALIFFIFSYLILLGLASTLYEIYRSITESKFAWRDDAMPQWASRIEGRH